tara:strand:- start:199 stop:963 length:765 start_codon:yes stop_codon:yes gene_type:complete
VDVYNGQMTGEVAASVTSASGISNATGPKVMQEGEAYCLQGGGKTSNSSNGNGVNKDVSFTLNGLDKHGVVDVTEPAVCSWNGDITPKSAENVSVTLRSQQGGEGTGVAHEGEPTAFHATQTPISGDKSPSIGANAQIGVAFTASDRSNKAAWEGEVSGALNCQMTSETSNLQMGVRQNMVVRRLTPKECCRLQAWEDTRLDVREELILMDNRWFPSGKKVEQADSAKYKQAGNGVASNCSEWIARRMRHVLEG